MNINQLNLKLMGIPSQFNDIIQRHLKVSAAWLPVTNSFTLGDYGIIADGVFVKMGNIQEFNVAFNTADGPNATIDFTSANTTVVKFAAGVEVDVIPSASVDAKISFKFNNEKSFLVKAPEIKVSMISNVNQVANQLKNVKNWGRKWKVVHQVYHAVDPLIISTIAAGTEVTIAGDVEALKSLKVGNASIELGTNKELGLKVLGKAGIIGLALFKLRLKAGGVEFLTQEEQNAPAEVDYLSGSHADDL
jgi:hypothetical protein